jgi:hypothetical protein
MKRKFEKLIRSSTRLASGDLLFQDIVARWPGSTHDSHIFNESQVKERFASGFKHRVLLCDGSYKLETFLMIPYRNPKTEEERNYNNVWNSVEQKYGVWKRGFSWLPFGLRYKLETTLAVIVACAVLHNFCILQQKNEPEIDPKAELAIVKVHEAAKEHELGIRAEIIKRHQNGLDLPLTLPP